MKDKKIALPPESYDRLVELHNMKGNLLEMDISDFAGSIIELFGNATGFILVSRETGKFKSASVQVEEEDSEGQMTTFPVRCSKKKHINPYGLESKNPEKKGADYKKKSPSAKPISEPQKSESVPDTSSALGSSLSRNAVPENSITMAFIRGSRFSENFTLILDAGDG